jgi:fused signal recognition particle receptor
LREGLSKTRENFLQQLGRILSGRPKIDAQILEEIEELMITSDLGVRTTMMLMDELEKMTSCTGLEAASELVDRLRERTLLILKPMEAPLEIGPHRPFVIMAVGVNGVGKTTTIAKIANYLREQGMKVLLVGADTFRAAAIEQLQIWAQRVDVDVICQQKGADPSAVVYDALQAARSRRADVAILDTAGRLHTKTNLMEELKKIKRVASKVVTGAPHEVLLVVDAITGQNALSQTRMFNEALDITGIAVTKLDGTAKGGIIVALAAEFEIPIRYVGVGEGMQDLKVFSAEAFVHALFGE